MDNQKPGPSKRLERAKSDLLPSRSNDNFKNKIRQKFAERIKFSRSKSVNHLRQLMEEIDEKYPYKTFSELKTILFGCPEAHYLISQSEINKIMEDIEQELEFNDLQKRINERDNLIAIETEVLGRYFYETSKAAEEEVRQAALEQERKAALEEARRVALEEARKSAVLCHCCLCGKEYLASVLCDECMEEFNTHDM